MTKITADSLAIPTQKLDDLHRIIDAAVQMKSFSDIPVLLDFSAHLLGTLLNCSMAHFISLDNPFVAKESRSEGTFKGKTTPWPAQVCVEKLLRLFLAGSSTSLSKRESAQDQSGQVWPSNESFAKSLQCTADGTRFLACPLFVSSSPPSWQLQQGYRLAGILLVGDRHGDGHFHPDDLWIAETIGKLAAAELQNLNQLAYLQQLQEQDLEFTAQLLQHSPEMAEQFLIDMTRNLAEARDILATLSTTRSAEDFANLAQGILRSLHSLKGSARQFSPGIGLGSFHESAHRIENFFTHSRADNALAHEDWEKVHAEFFRLKFTIQRMREIHDRVVPPRAIRQPVKNSKAKRDRRQNSVRIPQQKLDSLLHRVFVGTGVADVVAVRKSMMWLIQVPIRFLFDRLEKLATALAQELGVELTIIRTGDHTKIDQRLLPFMYEAFLHVIRNSLDHGFDGLQSRRNGGKLPALNLIFSASRKRSGWIEVSLRDDGRGIDPQLVLSRAVSLNLVDKISASRLSSAQILDLVFLPGFSTKELVTSLSGRGIGMDVVKETIEGRIGGKVHLASVKGEGTAVTAEVPHEAPDGLGRLD